jgi:hypothetical protein
MNPFTCGSFATNPFLQIDAYNPTSAALLPYEFEDAHPITDAPCNITVLNSAGGTIHEIKMHGGLGLAPGWNTAGIGMISNATTEHLSQALAAQENFAKPRNSPNDSGIIHNRIALRFSGAAAPNSFAPVLPFRAWAPNVGQMGTYFGGTATVAAANPPTPGQTYASEPNTGWHTGVIFRARDNLPVTVTVNWAGSQERFCVGIGTSVHMADMTGVPTNTSLSDWSQVTVEGRMSHPKYVPSPASCLASTNQVTISSQSPVGRSYGIQLRAYNASADAALASAIASGQVTFSVSSSSPLAPSMLEPETMSLPELTLFGDSFGIPGAAGVVRTAYRYSATAPNFVAIPDAIANGRNRMDLLFCEHRIYAGATRVTPQNVQSYLTVTYVPPSDLTLQTSTNFSHLSCDSRIPNSCQPCSYASGTNISPSVYAGYRASLPAVLDPGIDMGRYMDFRGCAKSALGVKQVCSFSVVGQLSVSTAPTNAGQCRTLSKYSQGGRPGLTPYECSDGSRIWTNTTSVFLPEDPDVARNTKVADAMTNDGI